MDCFGCKHHEILHQYEPRWCNKFDEAVKHVKHSKKECYEIDLKIKRRVEKRNEKCKC